jgi:hypothetical protein
MENIEITCTDQRGTTIMTKVELESSHSVQLLSSIPNILLLNEAISLGWEISKLPAYSNGSKRYWVLTDDIGNEHSWPGEWNQAGMVSFSSSVAERIRVGISNHKDRIYKEGRVSNGKG